MDLDLIDVKRMLFYAAREGPKVAKMGDKAGDKEIYFEHFYNVMTLKDEPEEEWIEI